jgi:hypothetical protein
VRVTVPGQHLVRTGVGIHLRSGVGIHDLEPTARHRRRPAAGHVMGRCDAKLELDAPDALERALLLSGREVVDRHDVAVPTTMSAWPRTIGAARAGMSAAEYWLSASVLTMTSAPSLRTASSPAWNADASPLLFVSLTMWSTRASDVDGAVDRAVVDDQRLHLIEPRDLPGQVRDRCS